MESHASLFRLKQIHKSIFLRHDIHRGLAREFIPRFASLRRETRKRAKSFLDDMILTTHSRAYRYFASRLMYMP